ncbi:MAG: ABC transporter ATP-binding protein [bacterium]
MSNVKLKSVNKKFGRVTAVRDLDLEIQQGEFFSILGPSGCGKTTTLRMVAGLEFPTSGQIFLADREVTFLKANLRKTGMVFQNFALFPHMTVSENIAFGLLARKVLKPDIQRRVGKALELVDLQGLGSRRVTQLSGGQQQRVALARAVVIEPETLLLDEPLSNLDAKLREETRDEIKNLQRRLGITTIYVTHDQEEALTLSDKIAIMNQGVCQQVGTPEEIYQHPANAFVANFVGNSNVLAGKAILEKGRAGVAFSAGFKLFLAPDANGRFETGEAVTVSLRPEAIRIVPEAHHASNEFQATIRAMKFSGSIVDYVVDVAGLELRVKSLAAQTAFAREVGSRVFLRVSPERIQVLPNA